MTNHKFNYLFIDRITEHAFFFNQNSPEIPEQERIADPSGTDWSDSTSISLVFDVNKKEKRSGEKLEQKSRFSKENNMLISHEVKFHSNEFRKLKYWFILSLSIQLPRS